MRYREITPCPALRAHVACYWTLAPARGDSSHRVLPDGAMDLLFTLSSRGARGQVVGVMTRAVVATPEPGVELAGVRFRIGEAPSLLGVSARPARDADVELDAAWGRAARELEGRIEEAPGPEGRVAAIERALLGRLATARPADARLRAAVGAIEASGGVVAVGALAGRLGLSERQLERCFAERVGLGPKALGRVVRLRRLVEAMSSAQAEGWASLAARVGYADQAHLAREVRELCGLTPGQLRRERAMSDLYNPDPDTLATMRPAPPRGRAKESAG